MTLGFLLFGVGMALLASALKDKSIGEILAGITGPDVPFGHPQDYGAGGPGSDPGGGNAPANADTSGGVSPFPKGTKINWGRSDQGIDGVVRPGTPLRAIYDGVITIAHNPRGFGANYPILHTAHGDYYYGHSVPAVSGGVHVKAGQKIATANLHGQGNATTPGSFEIGAWPPGSMTAGARIRDWLMSLPML